MKINYGKSDAEYLNEYRHVCSEYNIKYNLNKINKVCIDLINKYEESKKPLYEEYISLSDIHDEYNTGKTKEVLDYIYGQNPNIIMSRIYTALAKKNTDKNYLIVVTNQRHEQNKDLRKVLVCVFD